MTIIVCLTVNPIIWNLGLCSNEGWSYSFHTEISDSFTYNLCCLIGFRQVEWVLSVHCGHNQDK